MQIFEIELLSAGLDSLPPFPPSFQAATSVIGENGIPEGLLLKISIVF